MRKPVLNVVIVVTSGMIAGFLLLVATFVPRPDRPEVGGAIIAGAALELIASRLPRERWRKGPPPITRREAQKMLIAWAIVMACGGLALVIAGLL